MFSYKPRTFPRLSEALAKVARAYSLIQFIVHVLLIDNNDHWLLVESVCQQVHSPLPLWERERTSIAVADQSSLIMLYQRTKAASA